MAGSAFEKLGDQFKKAVMGDVKGAAKLGAERVLRAVVEPLGKAAEKVGDAAKKKIEEGREAGNEAIQEVGKGHKAVEKGHKAAKGAVQKAGDVGNDAAASAKAAGEDALEGAKAVGGKILDVGNGALDWLRKNHEENAERFNRENNGGKNDTYGPGADARDVQSRPNEALAMIQENMDLTAAPKQPVAGPDQTASNDAKFNITTPSGMA